MPTPRGATGPTTEHGKQIASRNAAKHNCTSKSLILPGETQAEFDALLENLTAEYQPETQMQQIRVNEAARATWELHRIHREYDKSQLRLYAEQPNLCDWTPKQQAEGDRMARYRTRAERTYNRALQSVECLRTLRLRAEQRAFWENLQEAKLDLSERRLQHTIQRFEQTTASPKTRKKAANKHEVNNYERRKPEAAKQAQPANTNQAQRQDDTANQLPQFAQTSPGSPFPRPRTPADFLAFATQLQEQQAQKQEKRNQEKMDREAMEQQERERKEKEPENIEHDYPEQENLVRSVTLAATRLRPSVPCGRFT